MIQITKIMTKLNNSEKAILYDDYLAESDKLQRINSKLKSEYTGNIPPHIMDEINQNDNKISNIVMKLHELFEY